MPSYDYTDPQGKSFTLDVDEELAPQQVYQRFVDAGIAPKTQSQRETPGYLSQLGSALGLGYRQMKSGLGATFNAATGDVQDTAAAMAEMGALQREQEANLTPEDVALNEAFARNEAEYNASQGLFDATKALSGYVGSTLAHPGAAFKQVVQSAPNALVGGATELGGYALGGLVGAGAGIETGPGAIATGIAGAMAGGAASNTLLEAGPAIFDILNERTNGAASSMTADQIAQVLQKNPDIMSEGLKTGAIRGSVIGAIEGLGMKGAGSLLTIPERAAARAMQKTLVDAGVDVASKKAVEKALLDPALRTAAATAAETAKKQFTSAGNLARFAGGAAIETGSAGAGELGAQVATGQQVSPTGVFQEMLGEAGMSLPLAGATKVWEARKYLVPQAAQNQLESSVEGVINNADVAPLTAQVLANESPDATPAGSPVPGATETEEILPGIGAINRADLAGIPPAEPPVANEPPSPESLVGDAGAGVTGDAPEIPLADRPSPNLAPRATNNVPPRPPRQGRDTSARDVWNEQYGDMRKDGKTHNEDGTPYQPTVYDEVAPAIVAARQQMTDEEANERIGDWSETRIATSIRTLINAGWTWDAVNKQWQKPANNPVPNETPAQAIIRLQGQTQPAAAPSAPSTPQPAVAPAKQSAAEKALGLPAGTLGGRNVSQPQTTQTNAIQKQSTGSVLQREQKEARKTGSERERVEPSLEGQEAAGARQEGEKVAAKAPLGSRHVLFRRAMEEFARQMQKSSKNQKLDWQDIIDRAVSYYGGDKTALRGMRPDISASIDNQAANLWRDEDASTQPITPQGKPTPATEGKVMPRGSAVERDATKPAQMTPEEFEKVKNSLNVKRTIAQSKLADAKAIQPSKNPAVQIKQITKLRARKQELDDAERAFEEFYPTMAFAVEDAIKNRQPFSTAAHKEIGMDYIPSGYVKQGDLYVFQPETAEGPTAPKAPNITAVEVIPEDYARAQANAEKGGSEWGRVKANTQPIEAYRKPDGQLKMYGGHHRLVNAQQEGKKTIPVSIDGKGVVDVPLSAFQIEQAQEKGLLHGTTDKVTEKIIKHAEKLADSLQEGDVVETSDGTDTARYKVVIEDNTRALHQIDQNDDVMKLKGRKYLANPVRQGQFGQLEAKPNSKDALQIIARGRIIRAGTEVKPKREVGETDSSGAPKLNPNASDLEKQLISRARHMALGMTWDAQKGQNGDWTHPSGKDALELNAVNPPSKDQVNAIFNDLVVNDYGRPDLEREVSQTTAAETQAKQTSPKKAKSAKLDESKAIAEYPDLETFFEREIFPSGKKGGWILKEKRTGARLSSGKTKEEASADFRKSLLWQQAWNEEYPSVFEMVNKLIEDKSINAEKYSQSYKVKPSKEEWLSILEGRLAELRQDREDTIKQNRSVGARPNTEFVDNFIANVEARLAKLQTTAAEKQTPVPSRKGTGAAGVVQSETGKGSILPDDETKETPYKEESRGKVEAGNAALDSLINELPPGAQAKYTPEVRAKASKFFETRNEADLQGLTSIQKTKVHEALYRSDKNAAEAEKAERKLQEKRLREQEQENARLEKERERQAKLTESRRNSLDSIIGKPQEVEMDAVSVGDGRESLAMVHNSGDVPGVLNAFVGTSKDFLANPENEKNFPGLYRLLKAGRVDEGNFAYGRAFVFTDGIGINAVDRANAVKLGVTPAVAAVRRVLIHESLVHRGIFGLPAHLQRKILQWVQQNTTPEQLDVLAKTYPQYADWRSNENQLLALCEEFLAKKVEKLTTIPKTGPLARLMDILSDIWRWITGNTGEPTIKNLKDVVKLLKAGAEAADARLVNGGKIKMSQLRAQGFVTPEMDKAYMDAVNAGDMEKAQWLAYESYQASQSEMTAKNYLAIIDRKREYENLVDNLEQAYNRALKGDDTKEQDVGSYFGSQLVGKDELHQSLSAIAKTPEEIVELLWRQYASGVRPMPTTRDYLAYMQNVGIIPSKMDNAWDFINSDEADNIKNRVAVEAQKWLNLSREGKVPTINPKTDPVYQQVINDWLARNPKSAQTLRDLVGSKGELIKLDARGMPMAGAGRFDHKGVLAVTRDDAGNVIPLSQRFNAATPDIRASRISYTNPIDAQLANAAERMRAMREREAAPPVPKALARLFDTNAQPTGTANKLFHTAQAPESGKLGDIEAMSPENVDWSLTQLDGRMRQDALGVSYEHYKNANVADQWYRYLANKVLSEDALMELNSMYAEMNPNAQFIERDLPRAAFKTGDISELTPEQTSWILINTDGEDRQRLLGVTRKHYSDSATANQWANYLAGKVANDPEAMAELSAMHQEMNPNTREEEVTPLDNIKRIVSESVSRSEVESLLKDLNTEEIKEVVRSIGYPTQGTKADNIRRILSFVGSRADAIAIRGINPINLNAPTIVRTPEQQAAFDEELRLAKERANELDISLPQKKPLYDQEKWNRNMAAIMAPSSVAPQKIRNEIRAAYDRASAKISDIWVPFQAVYDEVKKSFPSLTEREFGEQVQLLYEMDSAVVQNFLPSTADVLASGDKWGVYYNTGLGSASPASAMLVMPEIKASRQERENVDTAIHSTRGMKGKVDNIIKELPANSFTGKPLQDAVSQSFAPLGSDQFYADIKPIVIKSLDDMVKRGVDDGNLLETILDPRFAIDNFKGWNPAATAVVSNIFFAEALNRAVKKQDQLLANGDIAGYNLQQQKIDAWSKYNFSDRNEWGVIGNAIQKVMNDPEYQGLYLLSNFRSQKIKQEQEVTDSSMKDPLKAAEEIDKAGKDSKNDADEAVSDAAIGAQIDDEIAIGEAALSPENKTLWEVTKGLLRKLARLVKARANLASKGIKASNAAESTDDEVARYVQMGAKAVDKLIAETQAQIGTNLKKILGIETGGKPRKPRTQKEEAAHPVIARMISRMAERLGAGTNLEAALAALMPESPSYRDKMVDDIVSGILGRVNRAAKKPSQPGALAALTKQLKRILSENIKVEPQKLPDVPLGQKALATFGYTKSNEQMVREAWDKARQKVREMVAEDESLTAEEIDEKTDSFMSEVPRQLYSTPQARSVIRESLEGTKFDNTRSILADIQGARNEMLKNLNAAVEKEGAVDPARWQSAQSFILNAFDSLVADLQVAKAESDAAARAKNLKELFGPDEQKAFKALIRKLNAARPGETTPLARVSSWKALFEMTPTDQGMMKGRMFDTIKNDPAFDNLTPEEQQKLATLLEKAWDKRREQFLTRELDRIIRTQNMSKKAAKALEQRPAILRKIDSGVFDYENLAALVGEQYGIKNLTPQEAKRVKEISSELGQDLMPHERTKLQDELQELMVSKNLSLGEMLKAWWISSVLSGTRTAFTIGLSFMTGGFELVGHSMSVLANHKMSMQEKSAAISDAIKNWWGSIGREAKAAWMFVLTGDKTIQDPSALMSPQFFDKQFRGNMGRFSFSAAEKMIKSTNSVIRALGWFMTYGGRILSALDSFNYGITKAGSAPLVYSMLKNAYKPGQMSTSKLVREAKNEIIQKGFDGEAPNASTLNAWARNLAYSKLETITGVAENMNQVAKQGNFTLEPTGFGGLIYNALKHTDAFVQRWAEERVNRMRKDMLMGKNTWVDQRLFNVAEFVQAGLMQVLPILGLQFAKFATNSLNQTISFIPIAGLGRLKEQVDGQAVHDRMIWRNQVIGAAAFMWIYITLKAIEQEPDDEKRGWGIEGDWSNLTPQQKRQRDATGLKENTIWWRNKDGKRVVLNYVNWPVRPLLAAFGSMSDQIKYAPDQWQKGGVMKRGVTTGWAMAKSVLNTSAVSQFTELFGSNIASRDPVEAFTNKAARVFGGYAGGFVPRFIKDIDRWMQPEINKYEGWEYLGKELPFYRRSIGHEYLDVFGKVIAPSQAAWSREMVQQPMEPEYRMLGRLNSRGLWLTPAVAENRLVGRGSHKRPMTDEEAQRYVKAVGQGYREMILRYGDRLLSMPKDRAKDFLAAKSDDVRDRSVKLATRPQ